MINEKRQAGFRINRVAREAMMKRIMDKIKSEVPPGFGITVLVLSYGEGGETHYASTARREDMMLALREFLYKNKLVLDEQASNN